MAWGEACVCRMAWTAGAQVFPVDIGIAHPVEEGGLLRRHVTRGTRSIAKGPAMTRDEAVAAVVTGITLAEELKGRGYRLLAAGEMGIGNTTTLSLIHISPIPLSIGWTAWNRSRYNRNTSPSHIVSAFQKGNFESGSNSCTEGGCGRFIFCIRDCRWKPSWTACPQRRLSASGTGRMRSGRKCLERGSICG